MQPFMTLAPWEMIEGADPDVFVRGTRVVFLL